MADKVRTPKFRVSFPVVFKPKKDDNDVDKYSMTMLFPEGADLSELRKAADEAAREQWGDKLPKGLRMPFRDQGEKEYDGYVEGCTFINATSKQRPGLVDRDMEPITDERDFYPGCWGVATVRPFAYEAKGNKGVAFGLQNIMKVKDDDPIGGRSRPDQDFADMDLGDEDADADKLWGKDPDAE